MPSPLGEDIQASHIIDAYESDIPVVDDDVLAELQLTRPVEPSFDISEAVDLRIIKEAAAAGTAPLFLDEDPAKIDDGLSVVKIIRLSPMAMINEASPYLSVLAQTSMVARGAVVAADNIAAFAAVMGVIQFVLGMFQFLVV